MKQIAALLSTIPEKLRRLGVVLTGLDFVDLMFKMAVNLKQIQTPVQICIEEEARRSVPTGYQDPDQPVRTHPQMVGALCGNNSEVISFAKFPIPMPRSELFRK